MGNTASLPGWDRCGDGAAVYRTALFEAARPRDILAVDEWADRYRVLTTNTSAEAGPWKTSRTPYLRDPMRSVQTALLTVMRCGTQTGKTEVGLNWAGWVISESPGPMLIVQPTVDTGKRYSRQRLQTMIDASERLSSIVPAPKSRDAGNTVRLKEYPGGVTAIGGANSPSDLKSMPVRFVHEDEIDEYPLDLDDQGDVGELVDRRQSSYGRRRRRLRTSTPTLKDCSAIDAAYQDSDQRELEVPCPKCDTWDVLSDESITEDGDYLCPHCGLEFSEVEGKTYWYGEHERFRWVARNPDHKTHGYWLPSWYAALGLGYSWKEIAELRDAASRDSIKEKTYTNTIQGLAYEDDTYTLDEKDLANRRESFRMREVQKGVLVVTGSVDVQRNRFAVALWGWGRGQRCWLLDTVELPGDPTVPGDWDAVREWFARPLRNSYGYLIEPSLVAVDSGNWTQEVYNFVRPIQTAGWCAIKGANTLGKPVIAGRPSMQDVSHNGRTLKKGVALWNIGVEAAKQTLVQRLQTDADAAPEDRMIRFPEDVPEDTLAQLAAERYDPIKKRFVKMVGRRNELTDLLVYGYAMALHPTVRIHTMRDADWEQLEAELEPVQSDMFSEPAEPETFDQPGGGFINAPSSGFIRR